MVPRSSAAKLGHVFLKLQDGGHHAVRLFEKDLALSQQAGDRQGEARAFLSLGHAYAATEKHRKAAEMYETGLEIAREVADWDTETSICQHLAACYKTQGLSQLAEGLCLQHAALLRGGRRTKCSGVDGGGGEGSGSGGSAPDAGSAELSLGKWMTAVLEHRFEVKQAQKKDRQHALARIQQAWAPKFVAKSNE